MSAVSIPSHEMSTGTSAAPIPSEARPEHLDYAEDPCENFVRDRALDERKPADVDE